MKRNPFLFLIFTTVTYMICVYIDSISYVKISIPTQCRIINCSLDCFGHFNNLCDVSFKMKCNNEIFGTNDVQDIEYYGYYDRYDVELLEISRKWEHCWVKDKHIRPKIGLFNLVIYYFGIYSLFVLVYFLVRKVFKEIAKMTTTTTTGNNAHFDTKNSNVIFIKLEETDSRNFVIDQRRENIVVVM